MATFALIFGENLENDEGEIAFDYYKFGDELFGTPCKGEGKNVLGLFTSLLDLENAVNNPSTSVGKFWKEED